MRKTTTHKRNILIVEDEGDMRFLLEIALQSDEVEIAHANCLADALLSLKQIQPDVVLLDNRLPDGFGLDLVAHLKSQYPTIKIVMITGIDSAARDFALESGVDHFLIKPFNRLDLNQSINRLLN